MVGTKFIEFTAKDSFLQDSGKKIKVQVVLWLS